MSEILLRAEEARNAASEMRDRAATAQEQFAATRTRLTELGGSFKGRTADAFDRTFEEWRQSADKILQSLNDLSTFLDNAANTIEDTDQQIASQLG
jgi:WXG100 family type VII secretion target